MVFEYIYNRRGVKDLVATGAGTATRAGAVKSVPVSAVKDGGIVYPVYEDDLRAGAEVKLYKPYLLNCTYTVCGA